MTQQRTTRVIKPGDWLILHGTLLAPRLPQNVVRVAYAQRVNGIWTYHCTSLCREARRVTEETVSGRATRVELVPARTGGCQVCGAPATLTAGFHINATDRPLSHGELGWVYVGLCSIHAASIQ